MSRGEAIAYALGGPAANAILAVFLTPLALSLSGVPSHAVWAAIVLSASGTILNLVSFPGSDGGMAIAAMRGEIPAVDAESPLTGDIVNELGRWMALYTSARDPRFSKQRSYLFRIAPLELGEIGQPRSTTHRTVGTPLGRGGVGARFARHRSRSSPISRHVPGRVGRS
jgi:hypothetical protein